MKSRNKLMFILMAVIIVFQLFHIIRTELVKNSMFRRIDDVVDSISKSNDIHEVKFSQIEEMLIRNNADISLMRYEISAAMENVNENSNRQFSETVGIRRTYDKLLDERKKLSISTVGQDSTLHELIKTGNELFELKKYPESYEKFNSALKFQENNTEIRIKKALSRYLSNPLDSSCYREILEDCKIVRNAGGHDSKLDEIEKMILIELGELN